VADPSTHPLSPRMVECLRLAASGLTAKATAERLGISMHAAVTYRRRARERLGVSSTLAAAVLWARSTEVED
jgi:DNA-binding CsgD family transcriptional regulator